MSGGRTVAVVVDDDGDLRLLLESLLSGEGFSVHGAADGSAAEHLVARLRPDVITLDLTLPDIDGLALCRRIRATTDAYVVVLSSRLHPSDKLLALEAGADDYVTKPFDSRELAARLRAMLRRPRARVASPRLPADDDHGSSRPGPAPGLLLDRDRRIASWHGRRVDLTRTELDLLLTLADPDRRVWTRDELGSAVWGDGWNVDGHVVDVHVANARRKLRSAGATEDLVITVRGVGFRLTDQAIFLSRS